MKNWIWLTTVTGDRTYINLGFVRRMTVAHGKKARGKTVVEFSGPIRMRVLESIDVIEQMTRREPPCSNI